MVEGLRALERYCRAGRLSAEGRLGGTGPVQPVPLEDWLDGYLNWRNAGGGTVWERLGLWLDVPGGKAWGGLRFRSDELRAIRSGLDEIGATTHSYTTREEAEAAEAVLWPQPEGAPADVVVIEHERASAAPQSAVDTTEPPQPAAGGRRGPLPNDYPKVRKYVQWELDRDRGDGIDKPQRSAKEAGVVFLEIAKWDDIFERVAHHLEKHHAGKWNQADWPEGRTRRCEILKRLFKQFGVSR